MGRVARLDFQTSSPPNDSGMVESRSVTNMKSPDFTREFMEAAAEATRDAVAHHHAKGNPVYFTDQDGTICVKTPGSPPRKLSDAEIAALL